MSNLISYFHPRHVLTRLLPTTCVLCSQLTGNQRICHPCLRDLPFLAPGCPICAHPAELGQQCGMCLQQSLPYQRTIALFNYEWPIIHFIHQLKFGDCLIHAAWLGELLAEKIRHELDYQTCMPDLMIPVPLHPSRLRRRGYNQAVEIARPIAKICHIPIDRKGVLRYKDTTPQSGLKAINRKQNVRHAFKVHGSYQGCHIALVDDVITTGATLNELANLLLHHGADRIDIWTIAKRIKA